MDWSSEKCAWMAPVGLGFALVVIWAVMSLAYAYDRSLAKVNDSFTQGFRVVGRLGDILGALDRLSVDQQAFLSTGNERFQDGVIDSVETLELDMDMLNALAAKSKLHRAPLTQLSRAIKQVLDSVGECYDIKDVRGRAAALAFFESKKAAISEAKSRADELRNEITRRVSDRIRSARRTGALFEALL